MATQNGQDSVLCRPSHLPWSLCGWILDLATIATTFWKDGYFEWNLIDVLVEAQKRYHCTLLVERTKLTAVRQ